MHFFAIGISHKTCPVEAREKFFLRSIERELLLSHFKNETSVVEAFILSTCNRTEIYANLLEDDPLLLIQSLLKIKNLSYSSDLVKYIYVKKDRAAVQHFFSVATGLDSLILGEKQILGQVKTATELARQEGMMGKHFNILTNLAIQLGKKARTETQIDAGGSSISWAAMKMAENLLGELKDKSVLIIGAGKMGVLAAGQCQQKGIGQIYVMNRSHEKAEDLAKQYGGAAVGFWQIKDILEQADVCICSASCTHYLIERDLIEQVMRARQGKQLLFIDISMPRNIDPAVADIANVRLVEIDDLDKVVEENINRRSLCVGQVEEMIEQKVAAFYEKLAKLCDIEMIRA
ncbi:MAG: glutamyl-tRNA reductase [Omnitrophica WOR_2 bacterium RIFCSPHIGHO2_01_FULL_48_9]|uniref:Glutamyl-tRNA reductase n=1 Tax=Candidatus Sungbacteria bacterium RIFCSPHIGHO2_02_FULL_47_11 TaxID=1802270 RepID=A0A1G2KK19_9BACT|nr:MAG: glutamyl-tRNA reductase [Omnitrophica WOR_2 bacterium RIFCSPHIGHO2_01_FULL_48_9]OGZ98738.1 MAG: glutamyl-tRNA reductase [Candidatus Sungbacteria bacterium RIFCSPHIGHO2_02_FULL_47_11]